MTSQIMSRRVRSPEDIQVGDFVVVLHKHYQVLPDSIEPSVQGVQLEPMRVTLMPFDAGTPLKVVAVSLPFIMTDSAGGMREAIDTRRHVLAKVDPAYAMAAKPEKEKKKSKKGKRKGKKGKGKKR